MAAQQSQGIQTLLEAEKDAAKVVQESRQYRVKRLKDARTEAAEEIEAYRKDKEQEFSAFQSSHAGSTQDAQSVIDKETEERLGDITDAYNTHKDHVLRKLLDRVVLVQPELHRNLQKRQ
ncbi:H+-ATPase G subunit-domain-containing protein [Russula ochroleuca]|jgi:V-type H+-transporting ATPase subunit G|uniref:V-type proton ATPase subunit G n=1 Tax=Russula ochroleuca TaxID=152965 RepID=A0A9P5K029_9AGAM|nr:H+-ATPase G subunit-domain-containing protein [Russula ochroleuca]